MEKEMFDCAHCKKTFSKEESLLRHISHAICCKEHYGEERLNQLRRRARLRSRQKYNKKPSTKESEAKRYHRNKEKIKAAQKEKHKQRWVDKVQRQVNPTNKLYSTYKLYHNLYIFLFFELVHDIIKEKLVDTGIYTEDVSKDVNQEALEQTMETDDWIQFYEKASEDTDLCNSDDDLIEKAFEASFEKHFDNQSWIHQTQWTNRMMDKFDVDDCVQKGKWQAMDHYKEFCESRTLLDNHEDNTMDVAFDLVSKQMPEESRIMPYHANVSEKLNNVFLDVIYEGEEIFKTFKDSELVKKMQIIIRNLIETSIAKNCVHY